VFTLPLVAAKNPIIFPDSHPPGRALPFAMPAPLTRLAGRLGVPNADGELLARFVRDRDDAAFAALVHRHGPTVFGVCRRVLGNTADAEDAFQAVFLVLVNRADALTARPNLGDWLYGVAVRTALKARTAFARLRKHERTAAERRPELTADPPPAESWLDRELAALPDKFREPVVLCMLQDRSRAEVAAELGIPEGTLASRLDTARKRLAERLARHRAPLAFTGPLVPVPAAVADAAVSRATDGAGVAIHQLANEVTRSMLTNSKWPALVAAGVLTATIGGLLFATVPGERYAKRNAPVPEKKEPKWKQEFDQMYTLKDDELVKIIPRAERPECRKEFDRDYLINHDGVKPEHLEKRMAHSEQSVCYVFEVDAKGKRGHIWDLGAMTQVPTNGPPKQLGLSFWGLPYYIARIERYEIDAEQTPGFNLNDAMFFDMPDFVVRSDAPREKLIPALDQALREKLNAKFKVEWKDVDKEVWVASGKVEIKPRAWRKAGQVDIYSDESNVNKETFSHAHNLTPGHETGNVPQFLKHLRDDLQTWIFWTDDKPPEEPKFGWAHHWKKASDSEEWKADRDPEKVLKNVSEQTGLTFQKEKRKVPVLVVSERR
jgi:RNA polymerase sigma factor (sigma-70 family)